MNLVDSSCWLEYFADTPRPALGPHRLHQRPVCEPLAIWPRIIRLRNMGLHTFAPRMTTPARLANPVPFHYIGFRAVLTGPAVENPGNPKIPG